MKFKAGQAISFTEFRSRKRRYSAYKQARRRRIKQIILGIIGFFVGLLFVSGVIGVVLLMGYIGKINASLPDPGQLSQRRFELSTKLYDRKGRLLYVVYGDVNREFVPLSRIPNHTKWAVLAAEDITFYEHKGFDIQSILGVIYRKLTGRQPKLAGASTIDQQLVRNTILVDLLGQEAFKRSYVRKLKEILISIQLDKKLTKDQILELYLNEVPLGGVNYGFQAAAKAYFNKDVKDLTLAESAFLAGIIQAPSKYLQWLKSGNIEPVIERRNQVLDLMLKYKDKTGVTKEEVEKAKKQPIKLTPGKVDIKAPHFVFYVLDKLEEKYGPDLVKTGGLRVKTTLDLDVQKVVEEEIRNGINKWGKKYGAYNGAAVVLNPKNGQILAMVGSVDYNNTKDPRVDGNVNVTTSLRQMGSSVKPYTYLTAFTRGFTPGSPAPDIKFNFGRYRVYDWDKRYLGLLSVAEALNASRNIPAVYTLQTIGGVDTFLKTARKLGITTLKDRNRYGLSITLGAGEMKLLEHTNAYTAFANEGVIHDIEPFLEIKDPHGKVLYKADPKKSERRVFSRQHVYLLNWILCMIDGRHMKLAPWYYRIPGQPLCGKTGTTDGPKDLTAFLYYPKLVVGVWAGNNNGKITRGPAGQAWSTNVPLPIANRIMRRLVPKFGKAFYTRPPGVVKITVCKDTGYRAGKDTKCKKITTPAVSTQLPPYDHAHKILPICKVNKKVATNVDEAKAAGLIDEIMFFDYSLPNKFQNKYYLSFLKNKYHYHLYKEKPESAVCPLDVVPKVNISLPAAGDTFVQGATIHIQADISVPAFSLKSVEIYFDAQKIHSTNSTTVSFDYALPVSTAVGTHVIKVVAINSENMRGESQVAISVVSSATPTPTPTPTFTPTPTNTPTPTPTP